MNNTTNDFIDSAGSQSHASSISADNVSLGVVTHNEADDLPRFLDQLREALPEKWDGEIIFVDNLSTDKSLELLKNWKLKSQQNLNITIFESKENNIGAARAKIVQEAQQEWVAFTDPDCILPESWLEQLVRAASEVSELYPLSVGFGASNQLPNKDWFTKSLNLMMTHFMGHGDSPQAKKTDKPIVVFHLPTTNALFKKSIVVEHGNFSPAFKLCGEDLELGIRLTLKAIPFVFLPGPTVVNESAKSPTEWWYRMVRFGKAQKQVTLQHKSYHSRASTLSQLLVVGLLVSIIFSAFIPKLVWLPLSYFGFIAALSTWIAAKNKAFSLIHGIFVAFIYTHIPYGLGGLLYRKPKP